MTNCKNCGAPLMKNGDCEYCGTKAISQCRSGMEMTAGAIRCWVDGPKIGELVADRMMNRTMYFADNQLIDAD